VIMEKQSSFRGATMEKQQIFHGVDEKQGRERERERIESENNKKLNSSWNL
jgi:hypothetical protein